MKVVMAEYCILIMEKPTLREGREYPFSVVDDGSSREPLLFSSLEKALDEMDNFQQRFPDNKYEVHNFQYAKDTQYPAFFTWKHGPWMIGTTSYYRMQKS